MHVHAFERIGPVRYKQAYCDVGGMGLQIPMALALEGVDFLQKVAPHKLTTRLHPKESCHCMAVSPVARAVSTRRPSHGCVRVCRSYQLAR